MVDFGVDATIDHYHWSIGTIASAKASREIDIHRILKPMGFEKLFAQLKISVIPSGEAGASHAYCDTR